METGAREQQFPRHLGSGDRPKSADLSSRDHTHDAVICIDTWWADLSYCRSASCLAGLVLDACMRIDLRRHYAVREAIRRETLGCNTGRCSVHCGGNDHTESNFYTRMAEFRKRAWCVVSQHSCASWRRRLRVDRMAPPGPPIGRLVSDTPVCGYIRTSLFLMRPQLCK